MRTGDDQVFEGGRTSPLPIILSQECGAMCSLLFFPSSSVVPLPCALPNPAVAAAPAVEAPLDEADGGERMPPPAFPPPRRCVLSALLMSNCFLTVLHTGAS